jgi:hypothetical protein
MIGTAAFGSLPLEEFVRRARRPSLVAVDVADGVVCGRLARTRRA